MDGLWSDDDDYDGDDAVLVPGDKREKGRFERFTVKGPRATDCWIWRGAIADDGYGRFSIQRDGRERVVRANRYALALAVGSVDNHTNALHWCCDTPVCVRAEPDHLGTTHIVSGTQAQNLLSMSLKGRGGGAPGGRRWYGADKAERCRRARALREAVRYGWDADAVAQALGDTAGMPTLF